jgi:hypothetical protein
LSGKVTGWVLRHGPPDRTQLGVLVVLADAARNDGTGIRLSTRAIAARARLSQSQTTVRINQLMAGGHVERVVTGSGPGLPSEYRIPFPTGCGDRGNRSAGRSEPIGNSRSEPIGNSRSVARSDASSLERYGFNGNGSRPAGSAGGRRRPQAVERAERAAVEACELCDEGGWLWIDGAAARCNHRPTTARRPVR